MWGYAPGDAACPRCSSQRLRRSAPHDAWERLVRAVTPLHYYRCQECGFRGSRLGRVGLSRATATDSITPRPVEIRDLKAAEARRRRMVLLLLLAVVSGIAMGTLVNSCQLASVLAGF